MSINVIINVIKLRRKRNVDVIKIDCMHIVQ